MPLKYFFVAWISLSLLMVFSEQIHGLGIIIDNPSNHHEELLNENRFDILPVTYVSDPDERGYIYGVNYHEYRSERKIIYRSSDFGETWEEVYHHRWEITSVYVWKNLVFFSDIKGQIFVSKDNGKNFEKVLQLDDGKYAVWWSWASNDDFLLIGEYGRKSNDAKVYKTKDGFHFQVFFDIRNHYNVTDKNCHIHKVSIDPYDSLVYVCVGDGLDYRGVYIYNLTSKQWKFRNVKNHPNVIVVSNGPLAATYPDRHRVFFYTDNFPVVLEYDKQKDEITIIAAWFGWYYSVGMKFYDAVKDPRTGIHYTVSVDYLDANAKYLWISLDGITWYRIDNRVINGSKILYPMHIAGNWLFMNNIRMKLLTREEAVRLIYNGGLNLPISTTLIEGRTVLLPVKNPKNITVVVIGKRLQNLIPNPENWIVRGGKSELRGKTLKVTSSEENVIIDILKTKKFNLKSGRWYTLGACIKANVSWKNRLSQAFISMWTENQEGAINITGSRIQVSNEWRCTYFTVYIPESSRFNRIRIYLPNESGTYWIKDVFLSSQMGSPIVNGKFLEGDTYSKDVKICIDNRTYYIGDLKPGAKYIIKLEILNGKFKLLSGGSVDLVVTKDRKDGFNLVLVEEAIENKKTSNNLMFILFITLTGALILLLKVHILLKRE
ncbi:WD40/YVTN/BNR-like repeat-containing protein [Thermococcus paralvinellae]|uniref:Uncharacterized protein n=1 Tax=Thermococcus paralvinellae TaxID=582419 RepID=W0I736_9EURY|nr:hypothetical protein [Thermococcus paralvinellae]AHF80270.1 Hypothetical protein TES1_0884 [Thermococcus paralvinellae]